jgi:hypothetical protein
MLESVRLIVVLLNELYDVRESELGVWASILLFFLLSLSLLLLLLSLKFLWSDVDGVLLRDRLSL